MNREEGPEELIAAIEGVIERLRALNREAEAFIWQSLPKQLDAEQRAMEQTIAREHPN